MEDYDHLLSGYSSNEEAYYSDHIDSDIEAELYGLIHHDAQDNSISFPEKSDSVETDSVSLKDKSGSAKNNPALLQNSLSPSSNDSVLLLNNSATSEDTINSTKKQTNGVTKKNQKCSPVKNNHANIFSSDAVMKNSLYVSFENSVQKQKTQNNQVQCENSKRNMIDKPAKRKSDEVSEVLENIQLKKNKNSKFMQSGNSVSNSTKNKYDRNSPIYLSDSFVEVVDDSTDSDSSIILFEPDELNLETNISKEMVVLSSDSEESDSSMEKSFSHACQRKQTASAIANNSSPNNTDPWHINSEDKFRTKKQQSGRYHLNAVITCSKCKLKGHSAKFCSVPKAMKCFFCGGFHAGQECRNKICTKCFQLGHDHRRCYIRYVDTCELCRMKGHSEKNCPDLWRRYHLTTSRGRIVKGNPNSHSPLYCYNCGSKGHYGAECIESRTDRWSFPTWTSIISYKNPMTVLQRESEKNFFEQFNRAPETSVFDRTSETRRFNMTPEARRCNMTPEATKFNRTSETRRFNSRVFHRRKENETFLHSTPTLITKKKKKKKSKTPPNTNYQPTSTVKSTVQNDVYFPRTPKLIPSSSTVQLSKNKLKKLKRKNNNFTRQQMIHQIGLQQRLGLPFPSTV